MIIFYCDKCGVRVPGADLESGAASSIDEVRALCGRCGGGVAKRRSTGPSIQRLTPAAASAPPPAADRASGTFTRASSATTSHHRSAMPPPRSTATSSKLVLWGAIGAGGCILLLVVALASFSRRSSDMRRTSQADAKQEPKTPAVDLPPPTPSPLPRPLPEPHVPPVAVVDAQPSTSDANDPRAAVAADKLAEAKSFREKNPGDPWAFDKLLSSITDGYRGTPAALEAGELRKTLDLREKPAPTPVAVVVPKPVEPAVKKVEPVAPPAPEPTKPQTKTPAPEPDAYAVFLDGLLNALGKSTWDQVRSKMAQAGTNPKLAAHADDVKLDTICAGLALKVPESLPKGAGLLQQGQTVITLVDVDGKRYAIGKDANVLKVTETDLHIQQNAGGGSVELKVSLNSLSQTTLEELSRLGLGSGAEGTLAMAAYRIGQIHEDSAAVKREVIDQLLDEAVHKKAPEDQVATLKRWLAFMDREDQARTAWAALEEALAKKSHEKAKNAYDGFRKEFATTAVFAAMAPRFSEIENQLEGIAKSPGLYGGCWKASKDNQFSELVFQDVVRKVGWEKGDNARDKRFPNDWFSVRYGGLLRITQAGSYKFHFSADDWVRVWIDGKQVANGTPIELTQRDHPFRLEYGDSIRSDWLHLEWVPPGENNKVKIPDNVFWHLPSERESYLRLPAKPQ